MKKNKIALQIIAFSLVVLTFIACDDDFASLESDVINNDVATNYDIKDTLSSVITYTRALDPMINPVQTNGLGMSTLGLYDDVYGRTSSSFVSQFIASSYDPDFGDETIIDSVVVTIPYFSEVTGVDDEGNSTYEIDSILPKADSYNPIKLRIFENNYFIRDFDPNADFNESQVYYSNKTAAGSGDFSNALEGEELIMIPSPETSLLEDNDDNTININNDVYVLEEADNEDDDTEPQVLARQAPGIRIKLDPTFWQNKIIDMEGDPVLSNQNNFANYFKGLYFKAEAVNDDGSYLILNTSSASANITIHYSKLTASTVDDSDERDTATYVLNFGPNKINFFDNDYTLPFSSGEPETGDERIYLKGGEGAVAGIKLFDGFYDEAAGVTNFEQFRNDFVNLENGKFESSKRLVNEANLVFYVDRDQLDMLGGDPDNEPNRLYLYDVDNKRPLIDYFLDGTNANIPSISKFSHLGPLERVDEVDPNSAGVKYRFKITEHINNLLVRDSTNVELGLAVSLNVNIEDTTLGSVQKEVQGSDDFTVPVSSVLTPRGTILHGNNSEDESKRVYLEIYYTEPNY